MTSGEVMAFILAREDAVSQWRRLLGPTKVSTARRQDPASIRAVFGDPSFDTRNVAHGSDSLVSAAREVKFFFPDRAKEYLSHAVSPTLVKALTELCKLSAFGNTVDLECYVYLATLCRSGKYMWQHCVNLES
ncbi:nucleoside diphosphate kinase homolog 5-like [Scylla paramamosain]|uniref:nucleoside diphosphate kinase homolog 5-like n=1 Tax=Scylla paramamosain TaxID=85552 RepID=UPI00308297A2